MSGCNVKAYWNDDLGVYEIIHPVGEGQWWSDDGSEWFDENNDPVPLVEITPNDVVLYHGPLDGKRIESEV